MARLFFSALLGFNVCLAMEMFSSGATMPGAMAVAAALCCFVSVLEKPGPPNA